MSTPDTPTPLNILVYAPETANLHPKKPQLKDRNFTASFEPYSTPKRFDDFDGVVIFQRTFEQFERKSGFHGSYWDHSFDRDELDKRDKELARLLKAGGFACFVMFRQFVDSNDNGTRTFAATDLVKRELNYDSFYRDDFASRASHVRAKRSEFTRFCELYGAAWTCFKVFNDLIELRQLVTVGDNLVGFSLSDNEFFIPSMLPEDERLEEYFQLLLDAVVATRAKLITDIPAWVEKFVFAPEKEAVRKRDDLLHGVREAEAVMATFRRYKRILVGDSDSLVEAVVDVLTTGFGLKVDSDDQFKEDLKILGEKGEPVVFIEVKGTNTGVKREYINQADSHRERASLPSDFPSALIVNTHVKNSRTIQEKDQEVPPEQVLHAARNRVLIVRTLDLLRILDHVFSSGLSRSALLTILCQHSGWLQVTDEEVRILGETTTSLWKKG